MIDVATYRRYLRPSFLPVLAACPAAAQVTFCVVERFGEAEPDAVMDLGSDLHACVMLALLPLLEDITATPVTDAALERFPELSGWDRACAHLAVAFAIALVRKAVRENPDAAVEILLEQHLDGSVLGINRGGTADLIIVVPFVKVIVVDWKMGFLDQGEAADHDSLGAYAVLAAATFKTSEIEVYLYQPRAEKPQRASGATFDAAALKAQETWTRAVIEAATDPNPELAAGSQCAKCRALTRCPEAKEYLMKAADAYAVIGEPSNPRAWGELVTAAKVATKFGDEAQDAAKGYAIAGGAIDGWKLRSSGMTRKIDAPMAVRLAQDAGVTHLLLEHVSIKASAADALECLAPAVSEVAKSPALVAVKASAA